MGIRYLLILSLLVAPLAANADLAPGQYPAIDVQVQGHAGPIDIVAATIPEDRQAAFIHSQAISPIDPHRMLVVYSAKDKGADELDQVGNSRPDISVLKVSPQELAAATKATSRMKALTPKELKKAGILVTFVGLSIIAPSVYFTASTAAAFMASFAYIGTMVLLNDRTTYLTDYITHSAKHFEKHAKQYFADSAIAATVGYNLGRVAASSSYSFTSNSVTKFLINGFNIKDSLGSLTGLATIANSVVFSLLTSSVWDFVFAKLRESPNDEDKKIAQVLVWIKTLFLYSVSPLMLDPHTMLIGTGAMIALGVLGGYANYNKTPFVNIGRFLLRKMESSEKISKIVMGSLDSQRWVANWFQSMFHKLKPAANQCEAAIANGSA